MASDPGSFRRRPPTPGSLAAELRTLLCGAGLPCADPDAERSSAVGGLTSPEIDGCADIEWFVSQSARSTAAAEQTNGIPPMAGPSSCTARPGA